MHVEYKYANSDGSRVSWDSPVFKATDYDLNRWINVAAEAGIIVCLGASHLPSHDYWVMFSLGESARA